MYAPLFRSPSKGVRAVIVELSHGRVIGTVALRVTGTARMLLSPIPVTEVGTTGCRVMSEIEHGKRLLTVSDFCNGVSMSMRNNMLCTTLAVHLSRKHAKTALYLTNMLIYAMGTS